MPSPLRVVGLLYAISTILAAPFDPGYSFDAGNHSKSSSRSRSRVRDDLGVLTHGFSCIGATRLTLKYASAQRWQPSVMQTPADFLNYLPNVTSLPLACPQPYRSDPSSMSEDCLYMVLYIPDSLQSDDTAPTFMWIYGGSYIVGSASDPGLDGSKLAAATGAIVAVIQYRLGAFGLLAPNNQTNLAVKDVIVALQFLNKIVPSFGGDPGKITIAGQSSGADMVRALLAVDSASSLFRSAILQSDPMNYGFLSTDAQQNLQKYFNNLTGCSSTDTQCFAALSVQSIIDAENSLYIAGPSIDPSAGAGQPIRPVHDGTLIAHNMDSTSPFPTHSKPVLLSTVLNEAANNLYTAIPTPLTTYADYSAYMIYILGQARADQVLNSEYYRFVNGTDARVQLEQMATDFFWKCSTWKFAKSWAANGGHAYVGMYTLGASYPGNSNATFCTEPGVVCHQDDIEIVFGTVSNPTQAQSNLVNEMQARYKAFITDGTPDAYGYSHWPMAISSDPRAILLGSSGSAPVNACVPTFWGGSVLFDYQVYNT